MPRGERVGDAYVEIHARGDHMDEDIRKMFNDSDPTVRKAGEEHSREYDRGFERGQRRRGIALALAHSLDHARRDPALRRAADDMGKQIGKMVERDFDDRWITRTIAKMNKLSTSVDRSGNTVRTNHRWWSRFRDKMRQVDDDIDHYANVSGRAFGRGARNNFINLFGAGVRGFVLLANIIPKTVQGIGAFTDVLSDMRFAFSSASSPMRGLFDATKVGTTAFSGFLLSAVALGVGLAALILIIGPLISIISGLAAAVTALAASLSFAAAGAAGALVGALLPLAAGAGVVALAFIGMSKAQSKALSADFKPLTTELKGLGAVARSTLLHDIGDSASGLAPVIRSLRPLVHGVAEAMGDVFRQFSNSLQGSGFKAFLTDMENFLPHAVRELGSIFVNVFGGLGGLFRSLVPITNRFLNWLNRITAEFSNWINSPEGQAKMIAFWDKAGDAAKSVGHFIREAAVALGTLLGMGAQSGNNIFDSMADSLARFTAFLNANPGAVQRWFANGENIATGVGHAIMGIVGVFRSLDTETNRFLAANVFGLMVFGLNLVSGAVRIAAGSFQAFVNVLGFTLKGVGLLVQGMGIISQNSAMQQLGKDIRSTGDSMEHFTINMDSATGSSRGFAAAQQHLRDTLDQTTGAATEATREFIRNKLITSGAASAAGRYGVSMRDLISAATGNAGAIRRVNAALTQGGRETAGVRSALRKLGIEFDATGKIVRRKAADLLTWKEALAGIKSKDVRVAIRETGMQPTIAKFRTLIRTQKLTPRQVRIAMKALNTEFTGKQIRKLITLSKTLGRQKPKVKPGVDDKTPKNKFKGLTSTAKNFGKQKPAAKPDVKDSPAIAKMKRLNRQLDQYAKKKPTPKADVNEKPGMNALQRLGSRLAQIGRIHVRPQVSVNTTGEAGVRSAIQAINAVHSTSATIHINTVRTSTKAASGGISSFAAGSIARSARFTTQWGEAGPEAMVPLSRPLSQVDPSVRWLSAIAQGKIPGAAAGGIRGGRTVNMGGVTIVTPTKDPAAVATEVVNQLVAKGY